MGEDALLAHMGLWNNASIANDCIFVNENANRAFLCLRERSKTGSECSPKLEVLQDSAFETM